MKINNQEVDFLSEYVLNWKIYLFSLIIGAIVGLVIYKNITPLYEGVVNVEIAQIGQVQIESIPLIVIYLKTTQFIPDIFSKSGRPELAKLVAQDGNGLNSNAGIRFQARHNREANVLELKLRAESTEVIKLALDSIVNELEIRHEKLMKPSNDILESSASNLKSQISVNDNFNLSTMLEANKTNKIDATVIANQINSINARIDSILLLLKDINLEKEFPIRTSTHAVGEVFFVSKAPVYPRPFYIVTLTSIIGLILAKFFVFIRYKKTASN